MKKTRRFIPILLSLSVLSALLPGASLASAETTEITYDYDAEEIFTRPDQTIHTHNKNRWWSRQTLYFPDTCYMTSTRVSGWLAVMQDGEVLPENWGETLKVSAMPSFSVSQCTGEESYFPEELDTACCWMIMLDAYNKETCGAIEALLQNTETVAEIYHINGSTVTGEYDVLNGVYVLGEDLTEDDFSELTNFKLASAWEEGYQSITMAEYNCKTLSEYYEWCYHVWQYVQTLDCVEDSFISYGVNETYHTSSVYYSTEKVFSAETDQRGGDANQNGTLEPDDFVLMLKDYADSMVNETWTSAYPHCDLNDDGQVASDDVARYMQIYAAGLIG